MIRLYCGVIVSLAVAVLLRAEGGPLSDTFTNWIDHPAIAYRSPSLTDPVGQLNQKFAPDSVQGPRISMGNPRALFFNDSVAVGWVRGGFIELASQDPQQGVTFHTLAQSLMGAPQLRRRDDCLVWQVLSGAVRDPQYRHLSLDDRRAIVEILKETKRDLPTTFRQPVS
jgi:hypothetical protein